VAVCARVCGRARRWCGSVAQTMQTCGGATVCHDDIAAHIGIVTGASTCEGIGKVGQKRRRREYAIVL